MHESPTTHLEHSTAVHQACSYPWAIPQGMNYIGMVMGNKCRGSGYSDILIEAGLVSNRCLTSVPKGKAYAKALFFLRTVTEAMERLLLDRFLEEEEAENSTYSCLAEPSPVM